MRTHHVTATRVAAAAALLGARGCWCSSRPAHAPTRRRCRRIRTRPAAWYFDEKYGEALRYGSAGWPTRHARRTSGATCSCGWRRSSSRRAAADRRARASCRCGRRSGRELDRPERLPPPVTRLFYRIRDSLCTRGRRARASHRLARPAHHRVGDIENNSLSRAATNLDPTCARIRAGDRERSARRHDVARVDRQAAGHLARRDRPGRDVAADPGTRVRMGVCAARSPTCSDSSCSSTQPCTHGPALGNTETARCCSRKA